jgi:hypothetical protein
VRFLLIAAAKDLRWRRRDPLAMVVWMGIPLALAGLLGLVAGGASGPSPRAKLLVADQDDSFVSRLLLGAASSEQASGFLDPERVALDEGRRRIDAGDASALLVVPAGFGRALLEENPTKLTLVKNPAQRILPGIIEEGLGILVEAGFYAQRLIGEPLREIAAGPAGGAEFFEDQAIAAVSAEINQRMRRLDGVLFPPALRVDFEVVGTESASRGFGTLFFPGALVLALIFVAEGLSGDIWKEKESGVLRRIASTPHHAGLFLGGKLLAGAVVMAFVALVGLLLGALVLGLPAARLPLAFAWSVYAGCALLAFFLFLQMLGSSQRGAGLLTLMVAFPLIMLGGSFFPFDVMPGWMAAVGKWTPNGLAVSRLGELLAGEADAARMAGALAGIGVFGAAAFSASVLRLRGSFTTG